MHFVRYYDLDRPYNEAREIKKNKNEKEKQIAKIEEAAKKLKQSKFLFPVSSSVVPFWQFIEEKEKRRGSKKDKDPEKPDTFTEKLAAHLVKNLQVCVKSGMIM